MTVFNSGSLQVLLRHVFSNRDYNMSVLSGYGHMVVNIIVQVILIPVYLSYFTKPEFGVLMIILASINYIGFGVSWASAGVQRIVGEVHISQDRSHLERIFGLAKLIYFAYSTAISTTAFLLLWGFGDLWFPSQLTLVEKTVGLLLIAIPYMIVLYDLNVDRLVLIATANQAQANTVSMLALTVFGLLVIPCLELGLGLSGVMIANLVGVLVARIISYVLVRRQGLRARLPRSQEKAVFRRLLGPMGWGYIAYALLLLTLLQADALLLGLLGGAALVADFVLIWKVADVGIQILWRLPETLVPYLVHMDAKGEKEKLRTIYRASQRAMLVIGALAGIAYAVFGQTVVELWVGAENVPNTSWAYAWAGGVVFWMVLARLPAVYAYSLVKLKPLVVVLCMEVVAKSVLTVIIFANVGLAAPLISSCVVHVCGIAYLYQRLYVDLKL